MPDHDPAQAEFERLRQEAARQVNWKRWGPYLAERQWGTVREDYSPDGSVWDYLPHDHARSRTYRWGEDGLLGFSDRQCRLCFAVALWNGKDEILKERLFGVSGREGNHGEDVKENYYYLDSTPTHSYCKTLYKYPQAAFPYDRLLRESMARGHADPEFEIADTGVFDENRYFDVLAEYAKAGPDDILIRLTVTNRGPDRAPLHLLPTLWFRNTWIWGGEKEGYTTKSRIEQIDDHTLLTRHDTLGAFRFHVGGGPDGQSPRILLTDNETNTKRLFDHDNYTRFVKDAFHAYVIHGDEDAVCPRGYGTKAAAHYQFELDAGESVTVRLRLSDHKLGDLPVDGELQDATGSSPASASTPESESKVGSSTDDRGARALAGKPPVAPARSDSQDNPNAASPSPNPSLKGGGSEKATAPESASSFDAVFTARIAEADAYYDRILPAQLDAAQRNVARQTYAGLLFSKQFYHFDVERWLTGDPTMPPPPPQRRHGRNSDWRHLYNRDVISMPDKWEYPWYAAWDLAFHMLPFSRIDPAFAKKQLTVFLREWYMHPNGQLPAYEFNFSDVNPPVHAWAVWRVYKMTAPRGRRDRAFLASCFQKLLLNFTWWVNRKDPHGNHIFAGGFLGLDNIGAFDRSQKLPDGGYLEQADGTAWMAFFCGTMLAIAIELAQDDPVYEDMASKFFEHFIAIVDAMNSLGGSGLWDEDDGFYYDILRHRGESTYLKIRSIVGIIPLFAVEVLDGNQLERLKGFRKRKRWFLENRKDLAKYITYVEQSPTTPERFMLAVPTRQRLERVLRYLLDESEFLSPFGIRSLSAVHREKPYDLQLDDRTYRVRYDPGESTTSMFGGNSNWRGPVWFPVNFLLIEALERYHHFYGDTFTVECPTGSGNHMTLKQVARELCRRLSGLFLPNDAGRRPCHGDEARYATDPHFRDLVLFYEYFHGDTGRGCGASHQTGWTALVAQCLERLCRE